MKRLIRKILREEINKSDKYYKFLDRVSTMIRIPYFKSMEDLTIDDKDDQLYIMKKVLGGDISFLGETIYNEDGEGIYEEDQDEDEWRKFEYNDNGSWVYYEDSTGFWKKREYDEDGNVIYKEDSDGYWQKYEYDDNGNLIYFEDANGKIEDYR